MCICNQDFEPPKIYNKKKVSTFEGVNNSILFLLATCIRKELPNTTCKTILVRRPSPNIVCGLVRAAGWVGRELTRGRFGPNLPICLLSPPTTQICLLSPTTQYPRQRKLVHIFEPVNANMCVYGYSHADRYPGSQEIVRPQTFHWEFP